ncbi:MAG: hypothetical protein U0234_27410 [Sandaracinus sp.]
MSARVTARALLALDEEFVGRIRRGERLGEIARGALVAILLGGAAYGTAFGLWRGPEQALVSALKLPFVLLGVAALTAASSAVLAPLLGARLAAAQSIVAILVSLAVTAMLLGALAPVAIVLVLSLPPAETTGAAAIAQSLVLAHTLAIAIAGISGVLALLRLVVRLVARRALARRVVVAWMATQLLAGAQLSWLARPFLGAPGARVTWISPQALEGGFFEEVWRLSAARFAAASPVVLGMLLLFLGGWIGIALVEAAHARAEVRERGLVIFRDGEPEEAIALSLVASARAGGTSVRVQLVPDATLVVRTIDLPCRSESDARALVERIDRARGLSVAGPYRSAAPT